jgi:uncharacterized protein YwqG
MSFLTKWFKRRSPVSPEAVDEPLSFEDALVKAGLLQFREMLEPHVRNSIFMTTTPSNGERGIGGSHIGGLPDLPNGVPWPEVDGKHLGFLAQFNLAELHSFDKDGLLPSSGFLLFFYDIEQGAWGFDPKDNDHWCAIFHPGSSTDLSKATLPEDLAGRSFRECHARFSSQPTLPDQTPESLLPQDERYFSLLRYLGAYITHHQLLGHESPVQDDVKLECQLVSNGLYCGDPSGYNDPRAHQLRSGAADWLLLLQVDSDDNPQMMWGDLGRLYFCLPRQDLEERRFDRVWMVFQCH